MKGPIFFIAILLLLPGAGFAQEPPIGPRVQTLEVQWEEFEPAEAVSAEAPATAEAVKKSPRFLLEIGGSAGLLGGAMSFNGELRIPVGRAFRGVTGSLRGACGLAQGDDAARRYIPLQCDLIVNFPAGVYSGVENYIGCGANYILLTSGRVAGTVGGELFYGIQADGFSGKVFSELGYCSLNTGFGPSSQGVTLLLGYRRKWEI